jgi:hypothetical protein
MKESPTSLPKYNLGRDIQHQLVSSARQTRDMFHNFPETRDLSSEMKDNGRVHSGNIIRLWILTSAAVTCETTFLARIVLFSCTGKREVDVWE